ncbi:MAG: type IV-A pilus assembly ATPase PilB [Oligoflexia bacterium]|nr:type IV-A pilus assembly ATPase PilB [Oligoflexia bacterium]
MSRQLAELLLKDRIISQAQLNEAIIANKSGKSHVRFLIEKKYVAETKLLYYLSQKFGLPSINLAKFEVTPEVVKLLSPDHAKKNQVIPIQVDKGTAVVAIADPANAQAAIESLKFALKMNVEMVLTSYSAFDAAMAKYYSGAAYVGVAIDAFKKDSKNLDDGALSIELAEAHDIDSQSAVQDGPVIALVNGILSEGIRRKASDIHVEPYEKRFRVRMRVDGVLYEVAEVPKEMKRAVTARFKIMSRMDIAESRVPQDGRIKLKTGGAEIDFRVNSMPTLFGEKIVLRMLNSSNLNLDLMKLGFEARQLEIFRKGIEAPNGMVLVTGPTGSGKTTTLYSALAELNKLSDNLSTAEDPVEYNLEGINQVQVNKDIGLTFANVLRALLRQDPDVVLVGEIRDYETAEVAIQAALTGHLVLSTLHTNDAPSTITRLMNMGIEPFLVVASLNTIVAQRLLRTICAGCKAEERIPRERLVAMGVSEAEAAGMKCFKGKGCKNCNNSGYKGRVAIYEVLDFSQTLKEMVLRGETIIEIKKQAIREGMKPLRMSALTKVAEGRTSLEEAVSLTMES